MKNKKANFLVQKTGGFLNSLKNNANEV